MLCLLCLYRYQMQQATINDFLVALPYFFNVASRAILSLCSSTYVDVEACNSAPAKVLELWAFLLVVFNKNLPELVNSIK